jgi:hypothetical protein
MDLIVLNGIYFVGVPEKKKIEQFSIKHMNLYLISFCHWLKGKEIQGQQYFHDMH